MKHVVLSQIGTKVSDVNLSNKVFKIKPHNEAMYQTIRAQQASLRQGTSAVKNRSAVSGGGRKPWKQKGTGRARQGTIRAPQWKGGGVVFGPNINVNYKKDVNRKVHKLALRSLLSLKVMEKNLIVIDKIDFVKPSTKAAVTMFANLKLENKKILILASKFNENIFRSISNLRFADYEKVTGINVLDLVYYNKLIICQDALKQIEEILI